MEFNPSALLEAALQQGIWAALYIYLFFRMLKENASREERYQTMIDRLCGNIAFFNCSASHLFIKRIGQLF